MFTLCCQTLSRLLFLVKKALRLVLKWVSLQMRPPRLTTSRSAGDHNNAFGDYQDLLQELRSVGDLRWTFSTHGPSQHPANISAKAVKNGVLHSDRIAEVISKLQKEDQMTEAQLMEQVRIILDEMGHSYSIWYIRLLGFILIKAVRRMYEHIWVNAEDLRKLEPLFSKNDVPVIFMPTHRSYADFLLVSFISFHYGLPLPTIASGVDFMGMHVVGEILRKAGAFFIRRSFADDPLYRAVFAEYVQSLLKHSQPMEFFVEGTRSRSGKSLYPKFGLLQSAVEVFLRGSVSDILIIPITITYERTLEENLYTRELLGVPKPRESTSGLIKASRKVLGDNYGSMWAHFGTPISVRDYLDGKVDRRQHNLVPRNQMTMKPDEIAAIRNLAFNVIHEQQKYIHIHDWTILATVLLHRLRQGSTRFPVDAVIADCQTLYSLVRRASDPHRHIFSMESINHCVKIHGDVIRFDAGKTYVEICPEFLTDPKTLHMLLGHYRNQLLHRVIFQALHMLSSRMTRLSGQNFDPENFLKRIYSREFCLLSDDVTSAVNDASENILLETLMEPFLVGYTIILRLLLIDSLLPPTNLKTMRTLGKSLQIAMGKVVEAGGYFGFEILSLDLIANCLQAVVKMDGIRIEPDQSLVVNKEVLADLSYQLDSFLPDAVLISIISSMANMQAFYAKTV